MMGDRLRINAQLIDTGSDDHLRAERYDGDMVARMDRQESHQRGPEDALAKLLLMCDLGHNK